MLYWPLRLDFRRSLVSGLPFPRRTGSFPEQRLLIEPNNTAAPGNDNRPNRQKWNFWRLSSAVWIVVFVVVPVENEESKPKNNS